MQPIPTRLSHAIRTAFRAAKPATQISASRAIQYSSRRPARWSSSRGWSSSETSKTRFHSSDRPKSESLNEKVENAKDRIHTSLNSRAQAVVDAESKIKSPYDETIIHTRPESSSIVPPKTAAYREPDEQKERSQAASSEYESPLPSQIADLRSRVASRFSRFMDTFQSNVFIASQRLNDLTGYTGIERLKRDIDEQELSVQAARQRVKSGRAKYGEAISMRSATQREVNDLLHRKHTWSQQDLERFTNLYRSDHENERIEQKTHQELSEAEVKYEEASTRLAKCILARYHEEQIWSDKIRQMSTWGTWGLMGLNVLLFVVLQLAIEPWRRRRLVRGFEEKVEVALAAREQENQELRAQLRNRSGDNVVTDAVAGRSEPVIATASERVAEAIVDAITGSTDVAQNTEFRAAPVRTDATESAVEEVTTGELLQESHDARTAEKVADLVGTEGHPDIIDIDADSSTLSSAKSTWTQLPVSMFTATSQAFRSEYNTFRHQFNTTDHIVLSRRELTIKVLEGLATGMALAGGFMFILVRNQ